MRLLDIYRICKENYDFVREARQKDRIQSADDFYETIMHITEKFDGIEYFNQEIRDLNKVKDLNCDNVNFLLNDQNIEKFLNLNGEIIYIGKIFTVIDNLLNKIGSILNICESIGLQTDGAMGLDIKLPESKNFSDLRKTIDDLEFIFTKCPFFQDEKETLQFQGVDIGSAWLIFFVAGVGAAGASVLLNNIATFIDKCFIVYSHKLTTDRQKQEIRKAALEEKAKEDLLKSIDRIYKVQVNNAINELEEELNYKIADGEERGRAEQCMMKLEKLLNQGLQMYASIDTAPEAKALFEPLKTKYLSIENKLKAIGKKESKSDN